MLVFADVKSTGRPGIKFAFSNLQARVGRASCLRLQIRMPGRARASCSFVRFKGQGGPVVMFVFADLEAQAGQASCSCLQI